MYKKIFILFFMLNFYLLGNSFPEGKELSNEDSTEYNVLNLEKKEKKEDEFFIFAPENFIGVIMFIITVGGVIIIKKVYFDEEKFSNINRDEVPKKENKTKK